MHGSTSTINSLLISEAISFDKFTKSHLANEGIPILRNVPVSGNHLWTPILAGSARSFRSSISFSGEKLPVLYHLLQEFQGKSQDL